MTTQEKIESTINLTCNENAIALSEMEVGIIALDLLKSGLIAFGNKTTVADIEQGATFKWGKKEYIKLDATPAGCSITHWKKTQITGIHSKDLTSVRKRR